MNGIEEQDFSQKIDLKIWGRIIKYAFMHKRLVIMLMITLAIVALADIAYPLLSRYAIDNFIIADTLEGLGGFIAFYVAMIVIQTIGVFLFVSRGGKLEMSIAYSIRQDLFTHLQRLSFSFYDRTPVGYLMARMVSDVQRLSELIAWSIIDIVWALAYLICVIIVMFFMNWQLALLVVVVIPPLMLLSMFFQKKILKYQRRVRKHNSKITGSFNEGIMGAMTTKTLVREEANAAEFRVTTGDMKRASVKSATLSYIFMPLVMFLGSIATALVLYKGGENVVLGVMTFGTLASFISYTTQFFEPVQNIARIFAEMQTAQASGERIIGLLDTPCDVSDSAEIEAVYGDSFNPKRENFPTINGDIEFRDVTFAYKNGERVLEHFNLHVKAGENIALVGETGAGKSTIVNLVCRFYEPTEGQILIDGVDYRERSQLWLQSGLGYVLQQPHLFSGSIRDNIAFGRKDATDDEVIAAAKLVHAHDFIMAQGGYNTEVGEGGILLSTGQKQLISFARVVLADPRIFVLDEATSSIDTETEQTIQNAITNVLSGRTSFIVAHRLSTIRNADRILVIRGGKITEEGTHDELIKLHGYYYDLYTNQFREEASGQLLAEKH